MKALLLLLTSLFFYSQLLLADTIVMRDGRTVSGLIETFADQKVKFLDKEDGATKEFSLQQISKVYFGDEIYSTGEEDDLFCITKMTEEQGTKTVLRSMKNVELLSPYRWVEESCITFLSTGENSEKFDFSESYDATVEKVELVSAVVLTKKNVVERIPQSSFKTIDLSESSTLLGGQRQFLVKLPKTEKGSLVNLRLKKTRFRELSFFNFYTSYQFSSDLGKFGGLRVVYSEDSSWKFESRFISESELIRNLHSKEKGRVTKSWWLEPTSEGVTETASISITASEKSTPELITSFSEFLAIKMLTIEKSGLVKKAEDKRLDTLVENFRREFKELPATSFFDNDLLSVVKHKAGSYDSLAVVLLNQLKQNGFDADLLMCHNGVVDDIAFNFELFNLPVIRVNMENPIFFSTVTDKRLLNNLVGYSVLGKDLRKKIVVDSEVVQVVEPYEVRLTLSSIEPAKDGALTLEAVFPMFVSDLEKHQAQVVKKFEELYPTVENIVISKSEDEKTLIVRGISKVVSVTGENELLMFDFPETNKLVDAYNNCSVNISVSVKAPENYKVNGLPDDLLEPSYRRFLPTEEGFVVDISGGLVPDTLGKLVILKRKDIR